MITFDIQHDLGGATAVEALIAQTLSMNVSASAKAAKQTLATMERYKKAALRVTAAHARKAILEIFAENRYGWKKHQEYSNWFGTQGPVNITGLLAANKPKKTTTAKGKARKKGYSKTGYIKPPKDIPLGGRLVKSTRYKITDDNMVVGVLNSQQDKVKKKMEEFQDGGTFYLRDPESSRNYMAALGVYVKRSTVLNSEPRNLYDRFANEGNIAQDYKTVFLGMLLDGKRAGYK